MPGRIIIIHGPPASGKLTVARAVAKRRPMPVLHNHLTFNVARTLFEIDDPRLKALHGELRLTLLRHALAAGIPEVILTIVYAEPDSLASMAGIRALARDHQAELHGFYLRCTATTLRERVRSPDRKAEGKLGSPERLNELLAGHDYCVIPEANTVELDADRLTAAELAEAVIRHLPAA